MREIASLNMKRAKVAGDCRLVTPLEVLKTMVADIESGKLEAPDRMVICYLTMDKNNPRRWMHNYRCAGINCHEFIGLLEQVKGTMLALMDRA